MPHADRIDRAAPVREPVDEGRLAAFLADALGLAGPLTVEQFPGGFSNLTYLVRVGEGEAAREVVLRRPPPAAPPGGHDMEREFAVLKAIHGHVPAPEPLAFSRDALGGPSYLMERVRGLILRGRMPEEQAPDAAAIEALAGPFVETFAGIHGLDLGEAGLGDFGRPEGYVERQIAGWARRYERARTDDVPAVERVAAYLAAERPPDSAAALVHNDYKLDNLVLDPGALDPDDLDAGDGTRIRAVLDWEMATVGDPLMDLGSTLAYWIERDDAAAFRALALSPTAHAGVSRADLVARYEAATGGAVERPVFYYVYGLFKLIGIAQQIYARHVAGHTSDPRFAGLGEAVRVCAAQAERAIERGRISGLG